MSSSSLGALLGTEANAHDAADNAAYNGAARADHTDDDQDKDSGGQTSSVICVKLVALAIFTEVRCTGPVSTFSSTGLTFAVLAPLVVVAYLFVVL